MKGAKSDRGFAFFVGYKYEEATTLAASCFFICYGYISNHPHNHIHRLVKAIGVFAAS